MRSTFSCVGLLAALTQHVSGSEERVTPVQKVVQMMEEMLVKSKQDKQDEQVNFAKFSQFCEDTNREKTREIARQTSEIESLSADYEKANADASALGAQAQELSANIDEFNKQKDDATLIRKKENEDYLATHKDYSESLDALGRAIGVLKRQNFDRKQAQAFLQTAGQSKLFQKKSALKNFLQSANDFLSRSAPEANAYEFKSGGVIEMLEQLEDKFEKEIRDLETSESNKRHAYELMVQDLADSIESASKQKDKALQRKTEREAEGAAAKGDLDATISSKASDEKYLADLVANCQLKSSEYEERQKLREGEAVALGQAIEIISSKSVTGHADTYLPSLTQKKAFLSFIQLRRASKSELTKTKSLTAFLEQRASSLHSVQLQSLAKQLEMSRDDGSSDPFGKVRQMIETLIERLQQEAAEEAEHNAFCEKELKANKIVRETKEQDVARLTAQRDALTAEITKQKEQIAELSAAIVDLDNRVAVATEQRNAEKAKNTQTIADAKEAQAAVAQALQILHQFYDSAKSATAFAQGPAEDSPVTWDSSFNGQQGASGGVLGMLEVIQSDFARLEAETSSAENDADRAHAKFLNDSEVDKATKVADRNGREQQTVRLEGELHRTTKDLEGTQAELDAANAYFDKLKPSCIDAGVSYEERVQRREAEIQSLKEALTILSDSA